MFCSAFPQCCWPWGTFTLCHEWRVVCNWMQLFLENKNNRQSAGWCKNLSTHFIQQPTSLQRQSKILLGTRNQFLKTAPSLASDFHMLTIDVLSMILLALTMYWELKYDLFDYSGPNWGCLALVFFGFFIFWAILSNQIQHLIDYNIVDSISPMIISRISLGGQ